ncbi:MAG TPA: DUF2778 domain-containing protein [Pseudolabrys sp.]|nr:DUF2778 domain-containing protein [Pseudolabrys sp.]
MTYVTATYSDVAPFQIPKFPVGRSRRIAAKGLLAGTAIVAAGGVLAASLGLSVLWMSAVSLNVPTRLHDPSSAPLVSALGAWHRGLMRSTVQSGSGNGFGNAPDTPEFAALAPDQAPDSVFAPPPIVPRAPTAAPKPFVRVPLPRPRVRPPVAALPVQPPVALAPPQPVVPPAPVVAANIPLPLARPFIAQPEAERPVPTVARAAPLPTRAPEPRIAALPPAPAPKSEQAASAIGKRTAVYDIAAHTVYLPNGRRLEAHSGLGHMMDDPDPQFIRARMRGPTPPNVYALTLREQLFHGVRAIRLTPIDEHKMYGRDGMLAHTYMLGANGQSNGCVSFKNYNAFLEAYLDGQVDRMVVVPRLDARTRTALSLPAPKWNLFSAFAAE